MTRPSPPFPAAEDYLLGRLTRAERRQFEARLEQFAELRTQTRELEEGLVVLALAAPPCTAPRAAWQNIEAAIARPASRNGWLPWVGLKWFANSWGVAAGLAAILIVHLLWQRPATPSTTPALDASAKNSLRPRPPQYASAAAVTHVETGTPPVFQTDESRPKTNGLGNQTPRFPQPQPPGPKQSAPLATLAADCKMNLSPTARQTVLLAAARQLGLGRCATTSDTNEGWQQVDFVDLTTPAGASPSGLATLPLRPTLAAGGMPRYNDQDPTAAAGPTSAVADGAVPVMLSPPYVFALLDPSVLSPDMYPITFWQRGEDGTLYPIGVVYSGANPTIAALQAAVIGQPIFITGGISNGIIGQFPAQ
jgi:hypothetical protein